ncbi:(2Fe-2S)-binding protein [Actinokineospora guangxiensis]|uniref:(2Fe-2S)-binding protein n=1 Tax=Actinokineospora guangxiensis TaxID=1490288 RepID=A0ABW0EY72_9PSEU
MTVRSDGLVGEVAGDAVTDRPGVALRELLDGGISAVSEVSGAGARSLWAVAADSVGNQVLWAGGGAVHGEAVAAAVGVEMPVPRFVRAGGRWVVRRVSCCLVFEVEGEGKCVSCPRQVPAVRAARLEG